MSDLNENFKKIYEHEFAAFLSVPTHLDDEREKYKFMDERFFRSIMAEISSHLIHEVMKSSKELGKPIGEYYFKITVERK